MVKFPSLCYLNLECLIFVYKYGRNYVSFNYCDRKRKYNSEKSAMVRDTIFHVDKKQIKETKPTPPSPNPPSQKKPLRNSIFLEKPIGDQKAKTFPPISYFIILSTKTGQLPLSEAQNTTIKILYHFFMLN